MYICNIKKKRTSSILICKNLNLECIFISSNYENKQMVTLQHHVIPSLFSLLFVLSFTFYSFSHLLSLTVSTYTFTLVIVYFSNVLVIYIYLLTLSYLTCGRIPSEKLLYRLYPVFHVILRKKKKSFQYRRKKKYIKGVSITVQEHVFIEINVFYVYLYPIYSNACI